MSKNQFEEDVDYVRAALASIHEEAGTEPLSEDQQARFDEGLAFIADAEKVAARARQLDKIRNADLSGYIVETGDGAKAVGEAKEAHTRSQRISEDIYDLTSLRNESGRSRRGEIHDRARRAIDSWDRDYSIPAEWQESASRLTRNDAVAEHILRTGSPEYTDAYFEYMRGGYGSLDNDQRGMLDEANRALNEGSTSAGGAIVPPYLDPSIILTNNGTINPFRQIAKVVTIQTQTWKGVTSAGVSAEWTAEAAEMADASPSFTQPSITPIRADAYVQASIELLEDTSIASEIAMLFADAKDRLESTAFAVGSGSTQPKGVITAVSAVTASRVAGSSGAAGAADFVLADVYALAAALPPRHRPNSSWVGEYSVLNKIRRFGEGTTSNAAFWADLGVNVPPLLLGRPVYQSAEMDSTIVSGSNDDVLLIGDFQKYLIVDRIGMQTLFNPLVIGSSRRPTGEVGWACFWRVGADCTDTNAFRLLRL